MFNRRSLLVGAGALIGSQLLEGCGGKREATLRIHLLENSIPAKLLREFQHQLEQRATLGIVPTAQLADLFELLQTWKQQAGSPQSRGWSNGLPGFSPKVEPIADLAGLGDYWLTSAIQQQLIQPLDLENLAGWKRLPHLWQAFVRRNSQGQLSPQGKIWAAPYRWGTTVIAYRVEEFQSLGWIPSDWSDLWRSELRGHISLLDSARETIGLTLKKLGRSINQEDLNSVSSLKTELSHLHQQVKFYSSDAYLQPLLLGDTWAAVGWSTDILPLLKRDRRIAAIVPSSGTILTADLWVRSAAAPSTHPTPTLPQQWIDFCWQDQTAVQLAAIGSSASPLLSINRAGVPEPIQKNHLLLPEVTTLQHSEFLQPLPTSTAEQYRRLWEEIRQMG